MDHVEQPVAKTFFFNLNVLVHRDRVEASAKLVGAPDKSTAAYYDD